MNVETNAEYEETKIGNGSVVMARIWIHIVVDGHKYKLIHASGPSDDIKAYYDGQLTVQEMKARWGDNSQVPFHCVLGQE
jgi:hypothetical protein